MRCFIRRKFLQDVSGHLDAELNSKSSHRIGRRPIVWLVCIGNGDCTRIPADFRKVELGSLLVAVSDEDLTYGVCKPGPCAPSTFLGD